MSLLSKSDPPFAFELFVRKAFKCAIHHGYSLGERIGGELAVQRNGDPAGKADTATFEVSSLNYIKAITAYCFMIYERFLLNTYHCFLSDDGDDTNERTFVDEVVEATSKEQVLEIIERFSEKYLSDTKPGK